MCVTAAGGRTQRLLAFAQATNYIQSVGIGASETSHAQGVLPVRPWQDGWGLISWSLLLQVNVRNGLFVRSPVTGRRRLHQGTCQPAGDICKPLVWWCLWAVQL